MSTISVTGLDQDALDTLDALVYVERMRGRATYVRQLIEDHCAAQRRNDPNIADLVRAKQRHRQREQTALRLVTDRGREL